MMYLRVPDLHGPLLHGAEIPDIQGVQHGVGGPGRDGEVVHHRVRHVALHEPLGVGSVLSHPHPMAGVLAVADSPLPLTTVATFFLEDVEL